MQHIIYSNNLSEAIGQALDSLGQYNRLFLITDSNVQSCVLPGIALPTHTRIVLQPGDAHKELAAVAAVWQQLSDGGATRSSVVINLGGGVVTDLGGFAAATFKRGIRFINVPTTLLGAVDAAVGGKTGFNFNGLKNEIGAFREAECVIISSSLFATLPRVELLSGYAEMLKHALLKSSDCIGQILQYDIDAGTHEALLPLLRESVEVKRAIVAQDPLESGLRRALNLGHTAGHAFESLALHRGEPVPHGYAVAWGLVVELVISHVLYGFPSTDLYGIARFIYEHYGNCRLTCDDYPFLLHAMRHDKKSRDGELNFTLLRRPGDVAIDSVVDEENVKNALDIFRDMMHI